MQPESKPNRRDTEPHKTASLVDVVSDLGASPVAFAHLGRNALNKGCGVPDRKAVSAAADTHASTYKHIGAHIHTRGRMH